MEALGRLKLEALGRLKIELLRRLKLEALGPLKFEVLGHRKLKALIRFKLETLGCLKFQFHALSNIEEEDVRNFEMLAIMFTVHILCPTAVSHTAHCTYPVCYCCEPYCSLYISCVLLL